MSTRIPVRIRLASLLWAILLIVFAGCSEDKGIYEGPPIELPELPSYRFPVQIARDTELLVDQDGKPFFLHGDAGWSLISETTREDVELYLDDRKARGVNSVLVVLIDHTDPLTNAYGDPPFSVEGDFSTPNEAYFAYADEVIASIAAHDMQVWLSPIYLGYQGGDEGFYADMIASDAERMRDWGRWVGQRYGRIDGLVWLMGGDYLPPAEGLTLLSEVQAGIAEQDARHLFTAHWAGEVSALEPGVDWVELNNTYTYKPVYLKALEDYQTRERPFVLLESVYENGLDGPTHQMRAQGYYALLSGARGHFFGCHPIWKFGEGWRERLNSLGNASMMHLRTLFASIPWTTLVPDTEGAFITSGKGRWGTWDYAILATNAEGRIAVTYVPTPRELVLDLSMMAGPSRARWFDPTDGSYHELENSPLPAEAGVSIPPRGRNHEGDDDWLLLLEVED